MRLPINRTFKIVTVKVRHNKMMFMISHSNFLIIMMFMLYLAPEDILSVQLLIPQLYDYRIIVQSSEITLLDFFCIAPIIAVRLVHKVYTEIILNISVSDPFTELYNNRDSHVIEHSD